MYGIPHGCGANMLMWSPQGQAGADLVERGVRQEQPLQGQGHGLRQPDLHRRRGAVPEGAPSPSLKITNPYELDQKQFNAAVDLLKPQRPNVGAVLVGLHQGAGRRSPAATRVVGTTWQVIANLLRADKVKVGTTLPERGLDGLVGHVDDLVARRSTRTACTSG